MIELPLPPSTNNLFINLPGKGRVRSGAYKAWERQASASLTFASWDMPTKPYTVTIRLNMDHRGDIDNRVKAVLDLLVRHGVLEGDQWVNELHVYRDRTVAACQVVLG
jgi:Holliday junction resolvase RusA-like endonuclease